MSKLVLTRKAGESVKIADSVVLTIREVHAKKVYIRETIDDVSCACWMNLGDSGDVIEGCRVTICAINRGVVKLLFEAERSVTIVRSELINGG